MKKYLLALALVAATAQASALTTGDIAFTSFNADEDGWSMVSFVDIAAGTSVYFTDNEWNGSVFNTGESYHLWTTGTVAAGDVIRFSEIDKPTLSSSNGTLARQTVSGSTNYGISGTDDTIYAFLGNPTTAPTTFLAAISNGALGTAASGTLTNTGLTIGAGAMQLTLGSDYAEYTGARVGQSSIAAYKPLVNDVANWQVQGEVTAAAYVPNTTAFITSAVPEPESYAMLLAGLGLMGAIARKRRIQG